MSPDTSWTQRARSWVAPPPAWVAFARDREGNPIGTGPRLLLVYYWGLADAPSKREPGPVTLDVRDEKRRPEVLRRQVADAFDVGLSTLKGWERTLREAGLLARPDEGVIVLADVAATGYHPADLPGVRDTQGVEILPPAMVKNLTPGGQESDPPWVKNLTHEGSKFCPSEGQESDPHIRKPDLPDQDPIVPTHSEAREPTEFDRARSWLMDRPSTGQIARMQTRWLVELERRMLGPDGLAFDEVVRIVAEHERQTATAREANTLRQLQAHNANGKTSEIGIPELGRLWLDWSKATAWRAAALGQGVSMSPRSSFAGGLEGGLKYMDAARAAEDARRARK